MPKQFLLPNPRTGVNAPGLLPTLKLLDLLILLQNRAADPLHGN